MAQIVTVKNGTTNEIQYPRTVKSALLNDDGTPLNPLTGLELDTKVDKSAIVNDLTTGGATKVLSAEQGKVLQNAIAGINVNGGDADTVDGKHASDFLASVKGNGTLANDLGVATELRWKNYGQGHTIFDGSKGVAPNGVTVPNNNSQMAWGANYPILMGWNGNNTYGVKVDTARTSDYVQGRDLCVEVDGLKSSVVNGKQAVVNAINGSLGYASGLTTSHTHDDYAWWIQNKVNTTSLYGTCIYKKNAWLNGFTGMYAPAHLSTTYAADYIRYACTNEYSGYIRSTDKIGGTMYAILTIDFMSSYSSTSSGRTQNDISVGYIDGNGNSYTLQSFPTSPFYSYNFNGIRRQVSALVYGGQAFTIMFPNRQGHYIDIYGLYLRYL